MPRYSFCRATQTRNPAHWTPYLQNIISNTATIILEIYDLPLDMLRDFAKHFSMIVTRQDNQILTCAPNKPKPFEWNAKAISVNIASNVVRIPGIKCNATSYGNGGSKFTFAFYYDATCLFAIADVKCASHTNKIRGARLGRPARRAWFEKTISVPENYIEIANAPIIPAIETNKAGADDFDLEVDEQFEFFNTE